jgi:hypothetical protein
LEQRTNYSRDLVTALPIIRSTDSRRHTSLLGCTSMALFGGLVLRRHKSFVLLIASTPRNRILECHTERYRVTPSLLCSCRSVMRVTVFYRVSDRCELTFKLPNYLWRTSNNNVRLERRSAHRNHRRLLHDIIIPPISTLGLQIH